MKQSLVHNLLISKGKILSRESIGAWEPGSLGSTLHVSADMLYYRKMKQSPGCEIRAWAVQEDVCARWSWQRLRSSAIQIKILQR